MGKFVGIMLEMAGASAETTLVAVWMILPPRTVTLHGRRPPTVCGVFTLVVVAEIHCAAPFDAVLPTEMDSVSPPPGERPTFTPIPKFDPESVIDMAPVVAKFAIVGLENAGESTVTVAERVWNLELEA